MRLARSCTLLLAGALAFSSCTCSRSAPPPAITRHRLLTLPKDYRDRTLVLSDDGASAAYTERNTTGERLVHDGREGPLYAELTPPRMAPGTHRAFAWALEATEGKRVIHLLADGQPMRTDFAREGRLAFSPNGARWAAAGGLEIDKGNDEFERGVVEVYVDGKKVAAHADTTVPAFSPDGAHVAYLAEDAGQVTLMVDGQARRRFAPPPGSATPPLTNPGIGPSLQSQYDARYLSDGSLLVVATDGDGWAVFRDDTRLASYPANVAIAPQGGISVQFGGELATLPAIAPRSLVSAERAPIAAWWAREAGSASRWHVVRDGTPETPVCARPWSLELPVLSPDGAHVAYACHRTPEGQPDQVDVVFDRQRYGPYLSVWGIALSADGRRLAYAADDGSPERPWRYVVDGKPHGLEFDRAYPPRFSPDGRHVAWVGERHGRLILFLDGDGYASSDNVVWAPTFALGKGLSWAVLRGKRVSRIDVQF